MSIIAVWVDHTAGRDFVLPPSMQHYVTAFGEQRTIVLADGSTVVLAPHTTLDVSSAWSGARTVSLNGEAYFHIVNTGRYPFAVRAGPVVIAVLGTRFDARYDAVHRDARVAVISGKVRVTRVRASNQSVTLMANALGRWTDSTVNVSIGDADIVTSWMSGRLVFQKAPVSRVLAEVGAWYGYELRLADSSLARELVMTSVSARSAQDALAVLRDLLNVDMTFEKSVITLHPRYRPPVQSRLVRPVDSSFIPREVGR